MLITHPYLDNGQCGVVLRVSNTIILCARCTTIAPVLSQCFQTELPEDDPLNPGRRVWAGSFRSIHSSIFVDRLALILRYMRWSGVQYCKLQALRALAAVFALWALPPCCRTPTVPLFFRGPWHYRSSGEAVDGSGVLIVW